MKPHLTRTHICAALLLCLSSASWAISPSPADDAPSRSAARPGPRVAAAATSAPGLELARARLDAVDLAKGQLTMSGQVLPLHPSQLRLVSPAGQRLAGAEALRPGMWLRFAREGLPAGGTSAAASTDELARRIVLIYIER